MGSAVVVGYYSWALAVTTPVVMLSNLSLRVVLTGDSQRIRPFRLYLRLRIISTSLATVPLLGAAIMTWADTAQAGMLIAVGATKCVEAISDIYYGLYQRDLRADRLARSIAVKSMLGFGAFASVLALTSSSLMAFCGLILVHVAAIVFFDVPYGGSSGRDHGKACGGARDIWTLAVGAGPLGVVWMLNSVAGNAPRYLLEHYVGPGELGVFTAVFNVGLLSSLVCLALGETSIPRFASLYQRGDVRRFMHLLACVGALPIVLGVVFGLCAHLVGGDILTVVYGRDYASYNVLLTGTVVAFVTCNIAIFVSCALYATGEYGAFVPNYLINTGLVLLGSWLCVKHAHLVGGALSVGVIGMGSIAVAAVTLFPRLRARLINAQRR
jgi:O-antigen/teichoic acid export membrane protein